MNLLNKLLGKTPLVRKLERALEQERHAVNELVKERVKLSDLRAKAVEEQAEAEANHAADLAGARDELAYVKEKRNLLQRQFDDLRETVAKQAASVNLLQKDREADLRLLNEQRLTIAEDKAREERWVRAIDVLNDTLRRRNEELAEVREMLASARAYIARTERPVVFRREPGMSDEDLRDVLSGHAHVDTVKALVQVIDECAVQAMAEAAAAPSATITEGPHAARGFSAEDRTFSAGGVFALTELRRRIDELTASEEGRKAA